MISLSLIMLIVPSADVSRVVEGRLSERSALVLPLSARQLDGRLGIGLAAGFNQGDPARKGSPMSLSLAAGGSGTSLVLTMPWAVATGDPLQSGPRGNTGLGLRITLEETNTLRLGVFADLWFPSAPRSSARVLAFGFDLPRYAPQVRTFSLGAGLVWNNQPLIAGANAGVDTLIHLDPIGSNDVNAGLWTEAWLGAPLELDSALWISPLLEANTFSTISWEGAATDVVLTAGGSISFGMRQFGAQMEVFSRLAISAGYQIGALHFGPGSDERMGRVVVALDFSAFIEAPLYEDR